MSDPNLALRNFRHGYAPRSGKTTEYESWKHMIQRCHSPQSRDYPRYGGRGIQVWPAWRLSFVAFLEAVGPKPTSKHSLDRIDNAGHYEPGNVRWATHEQQMRNTRRNRNLTFQGKTMCMEDWARALGMAAHTLKARLQNGWPVEEALTRRVDRTTRVRRLVPVKLARQLTRRAKKGAR